MVNNSLIYYLSIIFTLVNIIIANVDIKLYAFTYSEEDTYYSELVKKFNTYSTQKSLGITLSLTLLCNTNSTLSTDDIANNLGSYLQKASEGENVKELVDIVTYDVIYSGKFSEYFVDLKHYISEEKIKSFIPSSIDTCTTKDNELISLPLYSNYGVLGYNVELLKKYNKKVPTTWKELVETAKFIVDGEKALGNNIMGYTSQHIDTETATCTALELLYSSRKKVTDKCPSLKDEEVLPTMETLKVMMEKGIATVESLSKAEGDIALDLWGGKTVFGRNWHFVGNVCNEETINTLPICKVVVKNARLPGYYEGVSASVVGGHNIAIPKSSKHIEEAVKVIEYLTSYDLQKDVYDDKLPAIPAIYTDPEVCAKLDCSLYQSIQPVARPSSLKDYDAYSFQFRENLAKAVKGEQSFELALIRNRNIIRYKSIGVWSWPSIIVNGLCILLILGCLASYFFIYCYYGSEHLCFISTSNWCIYILGCMFVLIYVMLNSGTVNNIKCHFRFWLLLLGYGITNVPIFARLMGNYPRNYGLPNFVRNNMTLVVNFLLFMEMGIAFLWALFSPFKTDILRTDNEMNESFYICNSDSIVGDFYFIFSIAINLGMTIAIAYLMFVEWRFPKYYLDLRNFCFIVYASIFLLIFEVIIKYVSIKNMVVYYFLHTIPKLLYVAYMTLVIFGLKLYYIIKDVPAEKKTIYSGKDRSNSCDKYTYQKIPDDYTIKESYTHTLGSRSPSNYSSRSPDTTPTRSTTIDVVSNYSGHSKYSDNSPIDHHSNSYNDNHPYHNNNKHYNIPNPNNAPAIITNSFQYPESLLPPGNTKVLMCGGNYNVMNVDSLLDIMHH